LQTFNFSNFSFAENIVTVGLSEWTKGKAFLQRSNSGIYSKCRFLFQIWRTCGPCPLHCLGNPLVNQRSKICGRMEGHFPAGVWSC